MSDSVPDSGSDSASGAAAASGVRFQAGGTLQPGALYALRPADDALPDALSRGALCYVLATRQMGKSSLRLRVVEILRARGVTCAQIDITTLGTDNTHAAQWYYGLMDELAKQLGLDPPDAFWAEHQNLGPVHAFSRYVEDVVLARVPGQVVVFLDEIDATRSLRFSGDDLFAALRALYNRRAERPDNQRLTFCLLGVAAPADLIADATRTPFNVGEGIALEDFSRAELDAFAPGLEEAGVGTGADTAALLDQIFSWTAGHPYMTHRVCEDLFLQVERGLVGGAEPGDASADIRARVAAIIERRFLHKGAESDANLQFAARAMATRGPGASARTARRTDPSMARRTLALYRRLLEDEPVPARADDPVQMALLLTGMAAERNDPEAGRVLAVRNRVFRKVFDADWVASREAERAMTEPLARWRAGGRMDEDVLVSQALAQVEAWARDRDDLSPDEQAFLQACIRVSERQRAQGVLVKVLVASVVVLLAVLAVVWWQYTRAEDAAERERREAERARAAEAEARRATADSEVGRLVIAAENAPSSVVRSVLAVEAWDAAREVGPGMRFLAEKAVGDVARSWPVSIPLVGHRNGVNAAAFSPDGTRIVTTSYDNTARVWREDGMGKPIVLRGYKDAVWSAVFSPDGTRIVTASRDNTARLWHADGTGEPLVLSGHENAVWNAVFSPDGMRIVTASSDHTARVWRADGTGEPIILRGHENAVWSAVFSPDGTRIVTSSHDNTARVWIVDGPGESIVLHGHESWVTGAKFNPDGTRIVTASLDNTARVWREEGADEPITLSGPANAVSSAVFSPNGARILVVSGYTVWVWPADAVGQPIVLHGHEDFVNSAAFSPDGTRIVTASDDHTAQVWRADSPGQPIVLDHEDEVDNAVFSPDGTRIITASYDGAARVWRVDSTSEPIILRGHDSRLTSAVFSPDGIHIVTASEDKTARVWRADGTGEPIVLLGHGRVVESALFSPDGTRIVTASADGTARVWRMDDTGEPIALLDHEDAIWSAVFTPDGTRIITASENEAVWVWRADGTGRPKQFHSQPDIEDVALSPDGTRIVIASSDKTASVWRADGEGEPLVLRGHEGSVESAAFSPDGTRIVTASWDGTVRIWTVAPDTLARSLCHRAGRNLTAEEWTRYFPARPYRATCAQWPAHAGAESSP